MVGQREIAVHVAAHPGIGGLLSASDELGDRAGRGGCIRHGCVLSCIGSEAFPSRAQVVVEVRCQSIYLGRMSRLSRMRMSWFSSVVVGVVPSRLVENDRVSVSPGDISKSLICAQIATASGRSGPEDLLLPLPR